MKDITIIIPIHVIGEDVKPLVKEALNSVEACRKQYEEFGKLHVMAVCPNGIKDELSAFLSETGVSDINVHGHGGATDFCSQINEGARNVKDEYFAILEFDDTFAPKWFRQAHDYHYGNETISIFIPVNTVHDAESENWDYGNAIALSPAFVTENEADTDDIGIINAIRLEKMALFNLTGAVFLTEDFVKAGMYKPSIKYAFNHELLLRMTNKGYKMMVVPKEGYVHTVGRKGSMTEEIVSPDETKKWFDLAAREYAFDEDRGKTPSDVKEEELK